MKHPNRSGRGKHFTKGKYVNIIKKIDEQSKCIKIRRTSKARIKAVKIVIMSDTESDRFKRIYKVTYNKSKFLGLSKNFEMPLAA